jgi:hypothetical protein
MLKGNYKHGSEEGRGQEAEGRRYAIWWGLNGTLVKIQPLLPPTLEKYEDISFCPLPSYFCLILNSEKSKSIIRYIYFFATMSIIRLGSKSNIIEVKS